MNLYVLTSNKYVHCLPPFAYLFCRYWGLTQPVTIVGYEERPKRTLPRNFTFLSLGKQDSYTFSSGLKAFLERIRDEYFILMLEDYFLDFVVRRATIDMCEQVMIDHPDVVKIDLTDDRQKVEHEDTEIGKPYGIRFIQSAPGAPFQGSLQAAIWRRGFLLEFLNPKEDAWMMEKNFTRRCITARREGFNGKILGMIQPPVHYINSIGGEGNHPHIYARKRFPDWMWRELCAMQLIDEHANGSK